MTTNKNIFTFHRISTSTPPIYPAVREPTNTGTLSNINNISIIMRDMRFSQETDRNRLQAACQQLLLVSCWVYFSPQKIYFSERSDFLLSSQRYDSEDGIYKY
jgi:hypothetical protein